MFEVIYRFTAEAMKLEPILVFCIQFMREGGKGWLGLKENYSVINH